MRAAILSTGHLRDACTGASFNAAPLRRQLRLCEAAFGACDIFVHTWSTVDAATPRASHIPGVSASGANDSWPCVAQLRAALRPTSLQVEVQRAPASLTRTWGNSGTPHVGYVMNVHGVRAALDAMERHARGMGVRYAFAARLRLDVGAERLQKIGGGNFLQPDSWKAARQWAAARRVEPGCAPVFSCHPEKLPGGIAGDNCFWSAPPDALSRSLHALSDTYAALDADDARVASCRRVRHPETLLACAMASAGVCGRNLSAAGVARTSKPAQASSH